MAEILTVRNLCKNYPAFCLHDVSFSITRVKHHGADRAKRRGQDDDDQIDSAPRPPGRRKRSISGKPVWIWTRLPSPGGWLCVGRPLLLPEKAALAADRRLKASIPAWDGERYEALLPVLTGRHQARLRAVRRHEGQVPAGLRPVARGKAPDSRRADIGLDPVSRDDLLDLLRSLCEQDGVSILFSTHITSDLDACADDVTYLQNGTVAQSVPLAGFTAPWKKLTGPETALAPALRGALRGLRVHRANLKRSYPSALPARFGCREAADLQTVMVLSGTGGGERYDAFQKKWKLVMMPVPLLFCFLSALVLVPNYPYYVTFFLYHARHFSDDAVRARKTGTFTMALLPVTKREMVRARFLLVLSVEALQVLVCVPFMLLRASYGSVKNAVGIEANAAFLGLSLVLLGLF